MGPCLLDVSLFHKALFSQLLWQRRLSTAFIWLTYLLKTNNAITIHNSTSFFSWVCPYRHLNKHQVQPNSSAILSNVIGVRLIICRIWILCMVWCSYFISMFLHKSLKILKIADYWVLIWALARMLNYTPAPQSLLPEPPTISNIRGSYEAGRRSYIWLT